MTITPPEGFGVTQTYIVVLLLTAISGLLAMLNRLYNEIGAREASHKAEIEAREKIHREEIASVNDKWALVLSGRKAEFEAILSRDDERCRKLDEERKIEIQKRDDRYEKLLVQMGDQNKVTERLSQQLGEQAKLIEKISLQLNRQKPA